MAPRRCQKLRDYSLSSQHTEGAAQGLGLRVGIGSGRIRCRAKPRLPLTGFRSNLEAMKVMAYCVYREDEFFVAQCLNVDVSSFGATREEAVTNLKEAVERWALRAAHVALTMCSQSATLFG